MLFQVQKVPNSGLYWLDTVLQNFYQKAISGEDFDDCFEDVFQPVLDASAKTTELFQEVFDQYSALSQPLKNEFNDLYNNHISLARCFSDATLPISEPSQGLNDTWKACKKLGAYLYSTTMGLVCFTDIGCADSSMDNHFEEYRSLNGDVCCFCGLQDYMEKRELECEDEENQWRASYDHYLAKKHYPFLSVSFENLIPCCEVCNEKAKGEIDLLKRDGNRYTAFHPFNDAIPVKLNIDYKPDNTFGSKWEVNVALGDLPLSDKMNNWDQCFKVTSRASKRINDHFETSYLTDLLLGLPDVDSVIDNLKKSAHRARDIMKTSREAYYKALCYEALTQQPEEVLESLRFAANQQYEGRSLD